MYSANLINILKKNHLGLLKITPLFFIFFLLFKMPPNKTITILGSLNYDLVTTAVTIPGPGETLAASSFTEHNGGKGANQALSCSLLRADESALTVKMIGCVGDDVFGEKLTGFLKSKGVDVSEVKIIKGERTGVATILVDGNGQNRILVYDGANAKVEVEEGRVESDVVVLQNEIPISVVEKVIESSSNDQLVVYNPSPVNTKFDSKLYSKVTCLIVNSVEAGAILGEKFSKEDDPTEALDKIESIARTLDLPKYLLITLGAEGVVYFDNSGSGSKPVHVSSFKPVKPIVDTTGAGDTFLGAVTTQLADGNHIEDAIKFAVRASSIAITRPGAGDSIPTYLEVIDLSHN